MKVLQLANGYYKTGIYQQLFAYQEELGIDNTVFVPINENETLTPSERENVHTYKCFHTLDRVLFYSKQAKMQKILERDFDIASFDLIHAHTVFSGGYTAWQFHRKYGIPYMVAVRDTDMNRFFKYMVHLRRVGVEILLGAERIIFLSDVYRRQLLSEYVPEKYRNIVEQKSMIVPNGISAAFLNNKGEARSAPGEEVRLIFVGDLLQRKNPEMVVRTAQFLQQRGIPVRLKMVGQIKEKKYADMIASNPWIEYHERCPQQEVIRHLRDSDILLVPSHRETFGLVYAEAMSQGLPVLYTRGQGFDGQLPDGEVGYPISDRDVEEIAEKVLLIRDHYAQMSQRCITASAQFDWGRIAEIYRREYMEIIKRQ